MTDSDVLVTEEDFARTYDGGTYDEAWPKVNQYRRVITYQTDNPDAGTGELMRVSGAAHDHVVSWATKDATPSVIQGLYKAHGYNLISVTYDEITPLNVLVANAISSGSINSHNYRPTFTVSSLENSMVVNSLELIGVGYQTMDSPNSSNPLIGPEKDAAVLGRVLSVLGVPVGRKTEIEDISLPQYLEDAPASVRKRFVDIYLQNHGLPKHDSAGLQIKEDRPQSYREELADLIASVAGETVTVTDNGVMVSVDAVRALGLEQESVA